MLPPAADITDLSLGTRRPESRRTLQPRIVERKSRRPVSISRAQSVAALVALIILIGAADVADRTLQGGLVGSRREAAATAFDAALGATVVPLDSDTATTLGICGNVGGLVVTSLGAPGPAARAGVQTGDVIDRIGGAPVESALQAAAALKAAQSPVELRLIRRGNYAIVRLPIRTLTDERDAAEQGGER
jgi:predicted metalloprotease with PDZ domain